jgi:O-antigen/teichoic acid export membrane protein
MLIRNTLWSFSAQIVRLGTALLLIALLDPEARGFQSLLVLLPTFIGLLTLLGVGNATPVLFHRGVTQQVLLANLIGLGLIVIGVLVVVLAPLLPWLARFLSGEYAATPADVMLGLLLLPPILLGDYLRSLLAACRDLKNVAVSHSVQACAQLLLSILLVPILHYGPIGAVWAAVLAGWIGFGYVAVIAQRLGSLKPRLDGDVLRPLLSLGLRGHLGNVVQTFNYRLDFFLVQFLLGQAAVGLYHTSTLLAEVIWYLPNAVAAALLPQIAATKDSALTPRVARHTLILTTSGACGLFVLAWPFLAFLRPAYLPSLAPMNVLLIGVVALSLYKVLASDLLGRGLPLYPSLTSILALVITIVGNLLLIPRIGIMGAAWTSTFAYTIQTIMLTLVYHYVTGVRLKDLLVPRREDLGWYRRVIAYGRGMSQ